MFYLPSPCTGILFIHGKNRFIYSDRFVCPGGYACKSAWMCMYYVDGALAQLMVVHERGLVRPFGADSLGDHDDDFFLHRAVSFQIARIQDPKLTIHLRSIDFQVCLFVFARLSCADIMRWKWSWLHLHLMRERERSMPCFQTDEINLMGLGRDALTSGNSFSGNWWLQVQFVAVSVNLI